MLPLRQYVNKSYSVWNVLKLYQFVEASLSNFYGIHYFKKEKKVYFKNIYIRKWTCSHRIFSFKIWSTRRKLPLSFDSLWKHHLILLIFLRDTWPCFSGGKVSEVTELQIARDYELTAGRVRNIITALLLYLCCNHSLTDTHSLCTN